MASERTTGIAQLEDTKRLRDTLQRVVLDDSVEETALWRIGDTAIFRVSSTSKYLIDGESRLPHADAIWKFKSPLKVSVFVWLLAKAYKREDGWAPFTACCVEATAMFSECPFPSESVDQVRLSFFGCE